MIFWTTATWVATPLAIHFFGFNGVAATSAVLAFSVVIVIYLVRRYVSFSLRHILITPLVATFVMGVIIYSLSSLLVHNLAMIFVMIGIGAAVYMGMMMALAKQQLVADFKMIRENLKK